MTADEIAAAIIAAEEQAPQVGQVLAPGEAVVIRVAGVKGDPGEPGAKGDQGDPGPEGLRGDIGPIGAEGPAGPIGPQGESGTAGAAGATGPQGEKGDRGEAGPEGPQGPQGEPGKDGSGGTALVYGGGGTGGVLVVKDEGVVKGTAVQMDFVGAGVSAAVVAGVATVTIPGGGVTPTLAQVMASGNDAAGLPITGLADPTNDQDAATKDYVDDLVPAFATPSVALGTAAAAGVASTVIRSDATIVAFDATVPTTSAEGDAAVTGAAAAAARRDHLHGRESFGTTAAAVGTSAGGSATTPSKSDHVHATGAGTPTTSAVGDAAATGAGPAAAMTNHVHGREAFGASAAAVGTSSGGAATTPSRSDHVHATGAGTPSTQAFGDAAAVGTGPAASMTDHKHGMPSERAAASTTPAAVGTAAVGTGTTDARADHVHATGAGTPAALAEAAATGSGPAAAMTDHVHKGPVELTYNEFTSTVSPTATTEGTANTVVTASAHTFDGAAVLIEFFSPSCRPDSTAANRSLSLWLYEDGASIGRLMFMATPAAAGANAPARLTRRMTPSAGSHTYSFRASVSAGTGIVDAGAGGLATTMPGFIRITKVV